MKHPPEDEIDAIKAENERLRALLQRAESDLTGRGRLVRRPTPHTISLPRTAALLADIRAAIGGGS